jgi:CheY-like chemotaxis protein
MNDSDQATVLIVEDDPTTQELLIGVLGEDWTVLTAEKGADALRIASEKSPDLILMDIGLPDIEGFDVCRQLKSDPQLVSIPVVFLTTMFLPTTRSADWKLVESFILQNPLTQWSCVHAFATIWS